MVHKKIVLAGNLAVVWRVSRDTTPYSIERVHNLRKNDLLDNFVITVNVGGGDIWILDDGEEPNHEIRLTWHRPKGSEYDFPIPENLDEALRPLSGVPASIWARAVSEAHERVCKGWLTGCGCTNARGALDKSKLLL